MKIKNLIIYIIVFCIIFASLKVPNILIKVLLDNIESKIFERPENDVNIDVEAEKIYLVKAIHSIRSDNPTVAISSADGRKLLIESIKPYKSNESPNVYNELNSLREYNILNNLEIEIDNSYRVEEFISKSYLNKNEYIINNVIATIDGEEVHFEIENKTGKIIYAYFNKEKLNSKIGNEGILRNFVKYLDLHIIKDWKYEEDLINQKYILKSEKADLAIILNENYEGRCEISVRLNSFWYKFDINFIQSRYNLMLKIR